jgi:hypothetical protein
MSGKRKVVYIALTVVLTAVFLLIGVLVFEKSYLRIWESCKDLGNSAKYYFCEIFGIEHSTNVTVGNNSNVIEGGEQSIMPDTPQEFGTKAGVYLKLLINGKNITAWTGLIGKKTGVLARFLVLAIPFFLLLGFAIKKLYGRRNTKHNHDTVPLRIFKGFSAVTYQPLKRFVIGYIEFLKTYEKIVTAWLILWAFHLNLATIVIEFIAYYLYFAVSYKLSTVYVQICKLVVDLQIVLKHFPWWSLGGVGWILFCRWREKLGTGLLRHNEARNCGFIKELPIVTMICGSMGKKKTTAGTDMGLSQTVMLRQEAFSRLQKTDMKFPFFPWICFEDDIKANMESGRVYNLASIHTWIAEKQKTYETGSELLYGYDGKKYGLYFDDCLKRQYIFEVLETYAKLYFIYVIESSLLVANYSIREDDILLNAGNFPLRSYDFFPKKPAPHSRYAHILDFDVLRLGKKVIANNPKAGSFEFGVVVITEVGKERKNNLELTDVKGKSKETNQKNDLFNVWLKMCRHAATVDNFPFIKVITDEQRAESWGADARELCDILTIVGSGKPKLALPFYTIEDMIACMAFSRFMRLYYDFRYRRGDNTLLVYLLKSVVGWIYKRNERLYNRFGYSVLSIEKERGTQDGKIEKKRYYLADYKIYRDRFSTDCFSDYFNDLALKTKVGLRDYLEYRTSKASVEELKAQNSYFINGLYGNAEESRGEGRSA